jgi:cytochrome oxidase Cu insertion factor (SCO1/SenC/PrrC family)
MTSQQQNAPRPPARVRRSRVNPMASVAAITAAALVGVGVLAVQANGSAPNKAPVPAAAKQQQPASTNQSGQPVTPTPDPQLALPAASGKGKRVVYSLAKARVWLVGADEKVQMSAAVVPGTVTPKVGTDEVSKRYSANKAPDNVSIQYEVLWGPKGKDTQFAFDAVASLPGDQMPPKPAAGTTTGSVRLTQNDAQAMWEFASAKGTQVVVVP